MGSVSPATRILFACLGLVAAASAFGSCAVRGFELVEGAGGGGAGGGGEAGAGAVGGGGSGVCSHVAPPPPPSGGDPGGTIEIAVALRTVDFGDETIQVDNTAPGYDLDGFCTCDGDGPSCQRPPWLVADACDAVDGRDNNLAYVFSAGKNFSSRLGSDFYSANMDAGAYSMLVHITGYNGEADDPQVTAAVYPSPGLPRDPCNAPGAVPLWDGSDRWPVLASALAVGGAGGMGGAGGGGGMGGEPACDPTATPDIGDARYVDTQAYVTDHTLVARLPEVDLILDASSATILMRATTVVVSARLERLSGSWALRDGILAGIVELNEMFRAMAHQITEGELVCTTHSLYDLIKTAVCQVPDITVTPVGPTQTCDAVSIGMAFATADPITLGSIVADPPGPGVCPAGERPEEDSCENQF